MQKSEATDEFTRLNYLKLEFRDDLPDQLFTLSSLKSPRR
jgi:hypothetical protein